MPSLDAQSDLQPASDHPAPADPAPLAAPPFDTFVMLDWSASSSLGRSGGQADGLWAGIAEVGRPVREPVPFRSRSEAGAWLLAELTQQLAAGRRVLWGVDVAFGYPAGTAAAMGAPPDAVAWEWMWALLADSLSDGADNRNDRFAVASRLNARMGRRDGPFWGRPQTEALPHLQPTKGTFPVGAPRGGVLAELRHTETHLRAAGSQPKSVWQLAGAGAVGSQSLTALPHLHRIRDALAGRCVVWPFETGFALPGDEDPVVVLAEVYPSLLRHDPSLHPVKDAAQVLALGTAYQTMQAQGSLAAAFHPPAMSTTTRRDVLGEEGWILPVVAPAPPAPPPDAPPPGVESGSDRDAGTIQQAGEGPSVERMSRGQIAALPGGSGREGGAVRPADAPQPLPAGIGVSRLVVYDTPGPDGLVGGSAHVHLVCTEGYVVLAGTGQVQTLTATGFAEVPLTPGGVVWFTPGTVHRLVNEGGLEVLVLMQVDRLPEAGDGVLTFPDHVLADPSVYAATAAARPDGDVDAGGLAAATRRRDLSIEGFTELRGAVERDGPAALAAFHARAASLVSPRVAAWRERWAASGARAAAEVEAHLTAISTGDTDHMARASVRSLPPAEATAFGLCGRLASYDWTRGG